MSKQLNDKEKTFVNEYLIDLDPSKAALAAGYSKSMAKSKAFQWVSNSKQNPKPYVRAAIQEVMGKRAAKLKLTADDVLAELKSIGFSNIADFVRFNSDGIVTVKDFEQLTPEQAACIAVVSQVETEKGRNFKFKLHDKLKALELIGKHINMQPLK